MSPAAPLFTVLPANELKRLLRQSLLPQTQVTWESLGTIAVTQGKLGVVDAASIHPRYKSEIKSLDWPHVQAEVWVQRVRDPGNKEDRIFAVLVLAPGLPPPASNATLTLEEGRSMAIDSATAAFGDYGRMLSEIKGGGAHAQTSLGRGSKGNDPQQKHALQHAAAILQQHGLPAQVETWATGDISVRFMPGLTDEQVARANALLAPTGCPYEVWIAGSHTSGLLKEALIQSPVTQLADSQGPYLFACRTGFGDGKYYWDSLQQNGQLAGYLCNFVPADEAAPAGSAGDALYEADPILNAEPCVASTRDTSRATLAPPTVPGVIVSIKQSEMVFWIARVERLIAGGFEVQKSNGERVAVAADRVVPNPDHHVFELGDQVLAHWDQGHMFPGTITAISQQGYTVTWADGDTPRVVPLGMLTFWWWTQ